VTVKTAEQVMRSSGRNSASQDQDAQVVIKRTSEFPAYERHFGWFETNLQQSAARAA
jgi:hypothetical protein